MKTHDQLIAELLKRPGVEAEVERIERAEPPPSVGVRQPREQRGENPPAAKARNRS